MISWLSGRHRSNRIKRWIATDRPDTIISCLPKVGHSTFRAHRSEHYTDEEAMQVTHRIGVLRHPMARIKSMYRFLKKEHDRGNMHLYPQIPTRTYEAFIDYTFKNYNMHWQHQHKLLETPSGVSIPTYLHRFEDIKKFWPLYFDRVLPHNNKSPSYELSDYREVELLTKYHRDLTLWTISEMRDDREGLQFTS